MLSPRARGALVAVAVAVVLAGTLAALLVGHWPLVGLGVTATVVAWFVLTFRSAAGRGDGRAGRR